MATLFLDIQAGDFCSGYLVSFHKFDLNQTKIKLAIKLEQHSFLRLDTFDRSLIGFVTFVATQHAKYLKILTLFLNS